MVEMVKAGAIITESGTHIPAATDTVCLHGDGKTAVVIARSVRAALADAGVSLQRFGARQGAISST